MTKIKKELKGLKGKAFKFDAIGYEYYYYYCYEELEKGLARCAIISSRNGKVTIRYNYEERLEDFVENCTLVESNVEISLLKERIEESLNALDLIINTEEEKEQ